MRIIFHWDAQRLEGLPQKRLECKKRYISSYRAKTEKSDFRKHDIFFELAIFQIDPRFPRTKPLAVNMGKLSYR